MFLNFELNRAIFLLCYIKNERKLVAITPFFPWLQVVGLNFSSATTPELLLKTFDHYCEFRRTPNGLVLSPVQLNKWLVLFCDEINLPDMDDYGWSLSLSCLACLSFCLSD